MSINNNARAGERPASFFTQRGNMNLQELSAPFPAEDIEWRVARAGTTQNGVWCMVLAYITARAIMSRLDEVVGPENWKNTGQIVTEVRPGAYAIQVGISILIGGEWVTKYDVSEPTQVEPAKGGFSGAMKRAGAQWSVGRYLYHLDETFAEISDSGGKGWNRANLPERGGVYYWKTPQLPAWALPKEKEYEVSKKELNQLKSDWKGKFADDVKSAADLREGFSRFIETVVGEFPAADHTCWTKDALDDCYARINSTEDGTDGVDSDVPFE